MQNELSIPLHGEDMTVERRTFVTGVVRISLQTQTSEHAVDETLASEHVKVERVSIGRIIESVPAIREEGNTTIIPVVEETLVTEKRLVLKEEIRLTRVRTSKPHRQTISLREQRATVERIGG